MVEAAYRMQAYIQLKVGMRLFYDCPSMSMEDFESDRFFRKYHGRIATIVSFPSVLFGPLNNDGRLPGLYLEPESVNVQFDGEEIVHNHKYLHHFVLFDTASTMTWDEYAASQRAGDLPHPVLFYQGDKVHKKSDLLQETRLVSDVKFSDDGEILYILAETPEAKAIRKAERAARIEEERAQDAKDPDPLHIPMAALMPSFPYTETCRGEDLCLVTRGNVYYLYNEPENLSFSSNDDEMAFWSQDGISKTVYGKESWRGIWAWPLNEAQDMLRRGDGDLMVMVDRKKSRVFDESGQRFTVRRLHDCFAYHRDRIRQRKLRRRIVMPLMREA